MKPRYLLVALHRGGEPLDANRLAAMTGLTLAIASDRLLVFVQSCGQPLLRDEAVILGTLFWRHGPARPIARLEADEAKVIIADAGQSLLERYWGGYIGVFVADAMIRVLRDPSGLLPCYYAATPAATLFASDADLLLASGLVHTCIDWLALARHHYTRQLPEPATALAGICELLPGCSLTVTGAAIEQQAEWTPWTYVRPTRDSDAEPPAEHLRRVVAQAVHAWASTCSRPLVSVSGGLDSSIVAACLARRGSEVRCLTMYTDDPAGDERDYARMLCGHLDLPLVERAYRLEDIDFDTPVSAHLPRPVGRTLAQAYERAHLEVADAEGCDAFITGNGGDNVFAFSQSAAAITDRYLAEGLNAGVLRTLGDVCRQTGCGPVEAIRAAWHSRRKRRYRWSLAPTFLDRDVCAAMRGIDHAWLEAPPDALPGKAAHIAGLLRMQYNLEPSRSAFAPVRTPLVSQPVLEACLAIPSWEWRAGGLDRSLARTAFAADLPEPIAHRRTKGGPDGFSAAILRLHREAIRSRLLEGNLAHGKIVDREALDARFRSDHPFSPEELVHVLDLLDTEAWTSVWIEKTRSPTSAMPPGWRRAGTPNG